MNMRVFKISGKSQRGKHEVEFTGYLVQKEETDIAEGYMEEQGYTPYVPERYIEGLYRERENQLAFAARCNNMVPLVYVFPNVNTQGFWAGVHLEAETLPTFWNFKRRATVQLEEVKEENEKQELAQKVATVKEKDSDSSNRSHQEFLKCVEKLPQLLELYTSSTSNTSGKKAAKKGRKSKHSKTKS